MNFATGLKIAAATLMFAVQTASFAAAILDQNNPVPGGRFCAIDNYGCGQSFMQAHTNIIGAGVFIDPSYEVKSGHLKFFVYENYSANPSNLIASATVGSVDSDSGWVDAFWSAVTVDPLKTYYLVLESSRSDLVASYSPIASYGNGNALYAGSETGWQSYDLTFRTYYDNAAGSPAAQVPEPATTALLGLGLLGFIASRRKSAKSKSA